MRQRDRDRELDGTIFKCLLEICKEGSLFIIRENYCSLEEICRTHIYIYIYNATEKEKKKQTESSQEICLV